MKDDSADREERRRDKETRPGKPRHVIKRREDIGMGWTESQESDHIHRYKSRFDHIHRYDPCTMTRSQWKGRSKPITRQYGQEEDKSISGEPMGKNKYCIDDLARMT